jgi:ATP-dependent RNA helicase RhlB
MEKPQFLTQTKFDAFDLPEPVLNGLKDVGLIYCTPIQAQTLPLSLSGKDVAGQAQTGTGKTAAFLVTVFSRLSALPERKENTPLAIIVAPTRELAFQIHDEAKNIGRYTKFRIVNVVGGVDYAKQAEQLRQGADIVIGTPGRMIDYFKQGILVTRDVKIIVIDEADRLLDLGFAKDMRFILKKLPHYETRQSMLFSATLSYRVMELTYDFMNLPEFISVTPDEKAVKGIEQRLFHVGSEKKFSLLLGILAKEQWERILIFVNTKIGVERLAKKLNLNGWPSEGITGDLQQRKRFQLMEQFKKGALKILVATDVASRGIHVEDVSHVINYDLPQDAENYIHRIGRTARAGKMGKALSLACEKYIFHLEAMEDMLGYKIPVVWPEDDWFVADQAKEEAPAPRPAKGAVRQRVSRRLTKKPEPEKPTVKRRPPGTFPGSFFGFGPKTDEAPDDVAENVVEEAAGEAAGDAPEKNTQKTPRKRHRRKKKTLPAEKPAAD